MKIPKRFRVHGIEYSIKKNPKLSHEEDRLGYCAFREHGIVLQSRCKGKPLPRGTMGQTYCHELMHLAFNETTDYKLRDDEKLCERVGKVLYEMLSTGRGTLIDD